MDRERLKYLMREVLGVDVDAVVGRIMADLSIRQARRAAEYTNEWKRYMKKEGGLVVMPKNVTEVGRKRRRA
jgi:hypothetical protein